MKLILICLLLGLAPLPASGRSPCIPELVGPRCLLLSPDGSLEYRVTIIGDPSPFCGPTPMPIPNSTVTIRFRHVGDTLTCFCSSIPGPRPHVFTASTNAFGEAVFHIAGGGCAALDDPAIPGSLKYAAEIFVDGIYLDELGIVSPDVVDSAGRRALDSPSWNPAGTCAVGLADAVEHTGPIAESLYTWCSDMNCDNQVSIADAVLMTPSLAGAASCSGDAGP